MTLIVKPEHMRGELGYCNRGARAFFARHGLDWSKFLREGVAADVLEATGDAMAKRVIERARKAAEDGR